MGIQVLPQAPSLAELLGAGVSQGVQTGMQGLLQKMLLSTQPMTPYQQTQTSLRSKELEQKEKFQQEKTHEWEYTQNKDFRKEVTDNYRDALDTEMRLKRMAELNKSGSLTSPVTATLLDKMGLPVSVLGNPDSEEFDKLSKDLLKNIRTYFGARINQIEVENFLKTIPSLMNSKDGRERIINNLQMLLEPRKLMYEEYRNIKQEGLKSGERLPIDLQETILDKIKPQLDDLSKRFEMGGAGKRTPQIGEIWKNPKTGKRIQLTDKGWKAVE